MTWFKNPSVEPISTSGATEVAMRASASSVRSAVGGEIHTRLSVVDRRTPCHADHDESSHLPASDNVRLSPGGPVTS